MDFILDNTKDNQGKAMLIGEILNKIENNKTIFETIDDCKFYEYLFLHVNYLNHHLTYEENINNINNDTFNIMQCDSKILKSKIFDLFKGQKNPEVIKEMSSLIYQIYSFDYQPKLSKEPLEELIDSLNPFIVRGNNIPCMRLLEYIIEQKEKSYLIDVKSHELLRKKDLVKISLEKDKSQEKAELYFYENTTIIEILNYFQRQKGSDYTYQIFHGSSVIGENDYNKPLAQIAKEKQPIKVIQKKIEKAELTENGKLTEKFNKVLKDLFNFFSKGKDHMAFEDIHKFISSAINKEIEVDDLRKYKIIKKYGDYNNKTLKEDGFRKIYTTALNQEKEDKQKKTEIVWKNLKNFGYNSNLDKNITISTYERSKNMRYYLSNKIYEEKYIIEKIIKNNKESNSNDILEFILFLSTNKEYYNNLLITDFIKAENKFTSKPKNYIENMYNLTMIESIIEDLEIRNLKKDNKFKGKICAEPYLPFDPEENYEKKKNFYINFIKNEYPDLIEYMTVLLKTLNEQGINENEILPMLCLKGLSIIGNIYGTFFEIGLKKSSDNYVRINAPNNLIKENQLDECITKWDNYKNIVEQIIVFLNKYCLKSEYLDKNSILFGKLMKNCYYLLFYLVYTSNQIMENINNNEKTKDSFTHLIRETLLNNKNIPIQLVLFTNKIRKKKLSDLFISFIIDMFSNLLKIEDLNSFSKVVSNNAFINYINTAFNYDLTKYNDRIKSLLIDISNNSYNLLKFIETQNMQEENANRLINNLKLLKKLCPKNRPNLNDEIINAKLYNGKTLYEIIIELFFTFDKNKSADNLENFLKIKEIIDSPEDKFISYDVLVNDINNDNNLKDLSKENELFKELYEYYIWCINSNKSNVDDKLKNIFVKQKELKQLEIENNNTYNSLVNNDNKEMNIKRKRFGKYTGLKNLAATCYLNSVMQLLFMIPEFRFLILSLTDGKDKERGEYLDDDNMFHQLQKLFTNLLLSADGYCIPKEFFLSLKDPNGKFYSNMNEQRDSQEFYLYICEKLESILESITPQQYLIQNFFCGKMCYISECQKCKNITNRHEEYKCLSLEVDQYKSLEESLNKYISSEKIKDFTCENCDMKVTINRKCLISQLPNYLVIHLKRLVKNEANNKSIKINSRFEFPINLNMKKYFFSDNKNEILNNDIHYEYKLKGINAHLGNADSGHFISVIKEEKEKWYEFDDTNIREFDINNLDNELFGGEGKFKTAYLLFYEKVEKQPIIKVLHENKINEMKNVETIEKSVGDNNDIFDSSKIYLDKKENIYYQFEKWDWKVDKKIWKEYFLDIFTNSKVYYRLLYRSDIYNFDDYFTKILITIINEKSFNINDCNNETYGNLFNIFLNAILAYYFREVEKDNKESNEEKEKNIILIIQKIIKPILEKTKKDEKIITKLLELINNILLSRENLLVIFSKNSVYNEEVTKEIYELLNTIIKMNNQDSNKKLFKNLNNIVNDSKNSDAISFYIYRIIFDFFKNKIFAKINLEDAKALFMPLFYKLIGEKNENNIKNISDILNHLINQENIFNVEEAKEIKLIINFDLVITLFNTNLDFLSILIQKMQYDDPEFSTTFNTNYIMKLYTYCDKVQSKEKKVKYNLMKLIISLFEVIDKYTITRMETLLGYPSLVFKSPINFGVSLMNNNIKTEIFEYISYNHIKKDRCVFAHLFPSAYLINNENYNLHLEEGDKLDLIYDLLSISLGLNGKKGNYFLFKFLYFTQSRNMEHENLYQEMKLLLENDKNQKYDLAQIKSKETRCIECVVYEKENLEYIITISTGSMSTVDLKKKKYKTRPDLHESFEECKAFLSEKINVDLYGSIVNIVPYQINKILISLIASNDSLSIFRFEYFTDYFTRKELLTFAEEKKPFSFEFIKRDPNNENKGNQANYIDMDYEKFKENKDFNKFLKEIDGILKNKGIVIQNNELLAEDDKAKKTIVRYFALSKKKNNVFKINGKKYEIPKDVENNFYVPNLVYDCVEKEKDRNIINIHRIKHNFNFLEDNYFGIALSNINYEKYFNEYFN